MRTPMYTRSIPFRGWSYGHFFIGRRVGQASEAVNASEYDQEINHTLHTNPLYLEKEPQDTTSGK